MDSLEAATGWQRQHQRHRLDRPDRIMNDGIDTTITNLGRDGIDGANMFIKAKSKTIKARGFDVDIRYGLDGSFEFVDSQAWIQFNEPPLTRALDRGRYITGSTYGQAGLFLSPSVTINYCD